MNGYSIAFISEKTGVAVGKLKMIVNRHPALQSMPYSVKSGGSRVFFDDFVVWLKQYEGVSDVESHNGNKPVTSVTRPKLPNGKQMEVLLTAVKIKALSPVQFQEAIGVTIPGRGQIAQVRQIEETPATAAQIEADLRSLMPAKVAIAGSKIDAAAEGARSRASLREVSKLTQERMNYHLPLGAS